MRVSYEPAWQDAWRKKAEVWRLLSADDLARKKSIYGPVYIDIAPRWFVEEFFPLN